MFSRYFIWHFILLAFFKKIKIKAGLASEQNLCHPEVCSIVCSLNGVHFSDCKGRCWSLNIETHILYSHIVECCRHSDSSSSDCHGSKDSIFWSWKLIYSKKEDRRISLKRGTHFNLFGCLIFGLLVLALNSVSPWRQEGDFLLICPQDGDYFMAFGSTPSCLCFSCFASPW